MLLKVEIRDLEKFEKSAEILYMQDHSRCRYVKKYSHTKGQLCVKSTEGDEKYLQFKTEVLQDLEKIDKFLRNLMCHMASKED
ncbi:signal recognition particle 9 kDa protein-like [Ctenocephalides felis]|uniref:signal recognition particle 9 kDa protein-like n=1 Tax=Ctenocephalides felis TaxID=7515 RepID=UPI000E6E2EBB|nr:signal recognition particle 9 kDa protein-like [Ctenocephalides felis]